MALATWDDIEYVDPDGLAPLIQQVTHRVDHHPGNDAFAAACNAATRTVLALVEEDDV